MVPPRLFGAQWRVPRVLGVFFFGGGDFLPRIEDNTIYNIYTWVVATQIFFYCSPRKIGEDETNLTNIFQLGWNHQLDAYLYVYALTYLLIEYIVYLQALVALKTAFFKKTEISAISWKIRHRKTTHLKFSHHKNKNAFLKIINQVYPKDHHWFRMVSAPRILLNKGCYTCQRHYFLGSFRFQWSLSIPQISDTWSTIPSPVGVRSSSQIFYELVLGVLARNVVQEIVHQEYLQSSWLKT